MKINKNTSPYKKIVLPVIFLLQLPALLYAQQYNPYQSIGKKSRTLTASNGKFVEVFDYDTVQRIGTVLYNIKTRRIVKLLPFLYLRDKGPDNAISSRWFSVDPLANKYPSLSPYNFVDNNPIKNVDPDGAEIVGETKKDARQAQQDIQGMFKGDKFNSVRSLITLNKKGTTFNSIDSKALEAATKDLSADDKALVSMVANTINSKDIHTIEYASATDKLSTDASNDINASLKGGLQSVLDANDGHLPAAVASAFGGSGITLKTDNGTFSVIITGLDPSKSGTDYYNSDTKTMGNNPAGEPATVGHELFGHGRSLALGRTGSQQADAIQTENLILRVMGFGNVQRDGTGHGNGTKVDNPSALPGYQ